MKITKIAYLISAIYDFVLGLKNKFIDDDLLAQKVLHTRAVLLKVNEQDKYINLFDRFFLTYKTLDNKKDVLELIVNAYAYGLHKGREEQEQKEEKQQEDEKQSVKQLLNKIIRVLHDENNNYYD